MKTSWLVAGLFAATVGFVPRRAQQATIPIIVKDTTSFYWQIVLAGRKAGKDLGVKVPELGRPVRGRHQRPDRDPRERRRPSPPPS